MSLVASDNSIIYGPHCNIKSSVRYDHVTFTTQNPLDYKYHTFINIHGMQEIDVRVIKKNEIAITSTRSLENLAITAEISNSYYQACPYIIKTSTNFL